MDVDLLLEQPERIARLSGCLAAVPTSLARGATRSAVRVDSVVRRRAGAPGLGLALALSAGAAMAEQLPLWEVGAGVAAIDFPDYRGADERSTYVLPIPYLVYRGEVLRLDREGLRGLLFQSERVELDLSVNASIPVESENNSARRGMPDLDPAVEIGPSWKLTLYGHRTRPVEVQLELPVRAAIATDLSYLDGIGYVFAPRLTLDVRVFRGGEGWRTGAALGPVFATQRYHEYFYSVAPQFARATRPAYAAPGGYSGTQLSAFLTCHTRRLWFGAFLRYDWLSGAVFEDSPLVKRNDALSVGIAAAWILKRSSQMVEARW
jgi:outer membrane scaffolding protein for murein synthesis (MipA/OmpV family)